MENKIIIEEEINISLHNLIEQCKLQFGNDVDFEDIRITTQYEQFRCFGYDLYDSSDHHVVTYIKHQKD